jgi:small subunit ribosomal protein S9
MPTKTKKTTTKTSSKKAVKKVKADLTVKETITNKPGHSAKVVDAVISHTAVKKHGEEILATGKRKTSVARVKFLISGNGDIMINGKPVKNYFPYFVWQKIVEHPLEAANFVHKGTFDIKVKGGGIKSQAEAVGLGLARALTVFNHELRKNLKPLGLLRRDSRIKERKKPGLKRARRAPQWTKR